MKPPLNSPTNTSTGLSSLLTGTSEHRTLNQNDLMWALLRDVSRQVPWVVNGSQEVLDAEDWKDLFTAYLRKEQRWAKGISGGMVALGCHTRKFSKAELSDLIELIYAFGAERGVTWSDVPEQKTTGLMP